MVVEALDDGPGGERHRAIFLDRDGTLIVERDYLGDPAGVELEAGAGPALARLQEAGWLLVLVTNQSGIARGYFSERDAILVNEAVGARLAGYGVALHGMYLCPHAPDQGCDCRKPEPGLLLRAAEDLGIDLHRSFMVGDKRSDLGAAARVGATGILVMTGHGEADRDWAVSAGQAIADDMAGVADLILASA